MIVQSSRFFSDRHVEVRVQVSVDERVVQEDATDAQRDGEHVAHEVQRRERREPVHVLELHELEGEDLRARQKRRGEETLRHDWRTDGLRGDSLLEARGTTPRTSSERNCLKLESRWIDVRDSTKPLVE